MATFDPNRIGPGTFELVRDPNTGSYSINEVGFTKISPLNLPDLDTTAATTTATQTQTATDTTGDTVSQQTKMAFNMPDKGGDNQPDTTGSMLQEARQTSGALSDTFADTRGLMTSDDVYRGVTSPLDIKDPTSTVFGRPREGTIDQAAIDRQTQSDLGLEQPTVRTDPVGLSARGTIDRRQGTAFARPDAGTIDQMAADATPMTQQESATRAAKEADFASGTLGVSTRETKEADFASGKVPPPKQSALETVSTSLKTTKDSIFSNLKTPMMMLVDAVVGPETASQKHDKQYFTDRGDGRIGGNPATDLYAGMNRVSMFGNISQAGQKRIERREKTIEKKGYGPGDKFYDDTQNMKDQQKDYQSSRDNNPGINPSKAATVSRSDADFGQFGRKQQSDAAGGGSSGGGGKIVCTMMNESYGFGSFRNKIWLRHSKNLAPEYQIGYHRIFLPLVKKAKTNKVLKKILEHIAIHRTIDIRQEEKNKIHLLGRVYRTILEPICYWVGKI